MNELWLASYLVLWVIVAVLSFITIGTLRELGLIQLRLGPDPGALVTKEGLERGTAAPDFTAADVLTATLHRLGELRGRRVLLLFLTPTCIACRQLMPHVREVARDRSRNIAVLAICHGSETTCGEFAKAFRLDVPVLLDGSNAIGASYDVRMTPFGFLIDEQGVVRLRGVVNTWPQLESLLAEEGTVNPSPWPGGDGMPASEPNVPGVNILLQTDVRDAESRRSPAVLAETLQRGDDSWNR